MGQYTGKGTTFKEVMADAQQYLEQPPMIALPGGTWCPFCNVELCRNGKHSNRQLLVLLIAKMARQIERISIQEEDYPHDSRCEGSMCYCASRAKKEDPERWAKYEKETHK